MQPNITSSVEFVMPSPAGEETRNDFLGRCMADSTMRDEYPRIDQRMAVCVGQWQEAMNASFADFTET
jgi:hypothetical protein